MLNAMTEGSLASSPMILSAAGHDEQPCEVNNSTTARGSACAGRAIATTAQTPSAPDHRESELWVIITATLKPQAPHAAAKPLPFNTVKAALDRPPSVHS